MTPQDARPTLLHERGGASFAAMIAMAQQQTAFFAHPPPARLIAGLAIHIARRRLDTGRPARPENIQ